MQAFENNKENFLDIWRQKHFHLNMEKITYTMHLLLYFTEFTTRQKLDIFYEISRIMKYVITTGAKIEA